MASIFSQIAQGQLPGQIIWRDEFCFALLTIRPLRPGHVLVVPHLEVDHWDDLEPELASTLLSASQVIAKAIKAAFPCARVGVAICGLEIPHTHIHLFPIDTMADFNFGADAGGSATAAELAAAADALRVQLRRLGHTAATA